MTQETAFELDALLTPIEAALDTLNVINAYFCDDGEPLSRAHVQQLGNALYTVERGFTALIDDYRAQVNAVFEARKEGKQ